MPVGQHMFHDIFTASRGRTACLVGLLLGVPLVFYFTRETSEGANSASSPNARVEGLQHRVSPLKLTVMSSHDQDVINLRGLDLTQPAIPHTITKAKESRTISEHRMKIEGTDVFYREALPEGTPTHQVLLLHGAAFSSETWEKLGTLQYLSAMGHRAVAIDVPEYGDSTGSLGDPVIFMTQLISSLHLSSPVIISPSMSGTLSLPYLTTHPGDVKGFVPVAPISTGDYTSKYPNIKTPTVIVYGDQDHNLGVKSLKDLSRLPNHVVVKLKDAKHPAYLQQPEVWHTVLHNFLQKL